jgi:hypothetical protein
VRAIHDGVLSSTRCAAPQRSLLPFTPAAPLVLYRPKARRRQTRWPVPVQQLWRFDLGPTGSEPVKAAQREWMSWPGFLGGGAPAAALPSAQAVTARQ